MVNGRVGSILDGSAGGVVSTQPIEDDGQPIYEDQTYTGQAHQHGEIFHGGEVIYDDPQPVENDAESLYESPSASNYGELSATDQIEQAFDQMDAEIILQR